MTKDELIQTLRDFYTINGRSPKKGDFNPQNGLSSYSTYYRRFGTLTNAIKEAGLKQNSSNNFNAQLSDEELLDTVDRFYIENGRIPKASECRKSHPYLQARGTYIYRFGSFKETLRLLDIQEVTVRTPKYSEKLLLGTLLRFYKEEGRAPYIKEYANHKYLKAISTYKERFGSVQKALALISVPHNKPTTIISNEELISSLKLYFKDNNRSPTQLNCANHPYLYGADTYYKRFGSFTEALRLAELPINVSGSSLENDLVSEIVSFYKGDIILNSRPLQGKELDILIPEFNLAIEFNGLYWHSESKGKGASYHISKTIEAEKLGYRLIHIFESEWLHKKELVISRIKNLMGLSKPIYARKCEIREISHTIATEFLNTSHIQGGASASIRIGLFYEEDLVAIQTFCKSRFSKRYEWELLRYCNALNTRVIGGASKLFKYFTNKYTPSTIVSYSDLRWNTGNIYEVLGFKYSHSSKPNYWYFKNHILESRLKYQKHKLASILNTFDINKTEYENMLDNGYDRIFDCGNKVYTWANKKSGDFSPLN